MTLPLGYWKAFAGSSSKAQGASTRLSEPLASFWGSSRADGLQPARLKEMLVSYSVGINWGLRPPFAWL